jgi:hypothetical protein
MKRKYDDVPLPNSSLFTDAKLRRGDVKKLQGMDGDDLCPLSPATLFMG